jgi:hypothetical protein
MLTLTKTQTEALRLYDLGIPVEIADPFLNKTLQNHRWGHHAELPIGGCPACLRVFEQGDFSHKWVRGEDVIVRLLNKNEVWFKIGSLLYTKYSHKLGADTVKGVAHDIKYKHYGKGWVKV